MSVIDNEDQKTLAETVRRFVAERSPLSKVREVITSDKPYDEAVWNQLAELGLASLIIPEEFGGAGATLADLVAALRELGYGLVPSPLIASAVLAAGTLLGLDDEEAKQKYLPEIASGELIATLAVSEPGKEAWIGAKPSVTATGDSLTGVKQAVVNGAQAGVFLVHASNGAGTGIYLVEAGASGLTVEADENLDHIRSTARLTFSNTPARLLAGDAAAALDKVADLANVVIAAEQSGATKRALEITTEYAKIRYSFGLPIGSYQGVKHKLADIYTDWALVDASVRVAVEAIDAGAADASIAATSARVLSSPAYVNAGKQAMLLHGGIGFTWEHDAHFFYKNAIGDNVLFGGPTYQQARLADKLGVTA